MKWFLFKAEKQMTQSVVSQMTASGASADDLGLDLGDALSESNDGNEDGEQSAKAVSSLELENRLLRSEIASLNVEMAAVIKRAKDSQDGEIENYLLCGEVEKEYPV